MPKRGPIGSYGPNQALWAHVWAKNGPETPRNATGFGSARPEQEILSETLNTPWLSPFCPSRRASSACQSVVLSVPMAKTRHSGRMFGRKWPETRPNSDQRDPNRKFCLKLYTHPGGPQIATSFFFFCLSRRTSRACQSVVLSVPMAKTRHSGRMFGRKRLENGPKRHEI
jgi:hypothetical protein